MNITEDMQRCIALCRECHDLCLRTVTHCLQKGGRHAGASHIRLLLDCAQICDTSADFMIRGSDLHSATCGACGEVCDRCAEDCQRLANEDDDEMMRRCAKVCRDCAEKCHQMSGALMTAEAGRL